MGGIWWDLDENLQPYNLPIGSHPDMGNRWRRQQWAGFVWVSTVFLCIDHGFGDGPPVLFETMAFGGDGKDLACFRSHTVEEALATHRAVVRRLWVSPRIQLRAALERLRGLMGEER
jgi:hypothetical protein